MAAEPRRSRARRRRSFCRYCGALTTRTDGVCSAHADLLVREALTRDDGSTILPTDPDALRALVALGILEVVQEADDEADVMYRMPDPEGVRRALDELEVVEATREKGA